LSNRFSVRPLSIVPKEKFTEESSISDLTGEVPPYSFFVFGTKGDFSFKSSKAGEKATMTRCIEERQKVG
jgi:hypothetical protein